MRFWNQCRNNNCPEFSRQWARERRENQVGQCYAESWRGGAFGILSHPLLPPPQQKRGRRGGKGKWGHAKLQEPVYKKSWNTGSLRLSLGPALLGSGEVSYGGNTEVRIRPRPG